MLLELLCQLIRLEYFKVFKARNVTNFFYFFAGNVGSLKSQISKKIQKPKYLAKCMYIYMLQGSAGAH